MNNVVELDQVHCICIDPAHVDKIWPLVSAILQEAMANGNGDFADIEGSVLSGEKLLWVAADTQTIWAAAVTGLHFERGSKFCCIWACSGRDKARWFHFKPQIEKFAKDEGCEFIRVYGRKGWARELPDYRLTQIVLQKAL